MRAVSVYLITNLVNGKVYVGKSVNPVERWRDHKKVGDGGKDKYPDDFFAVHAALHKYGTNNFQFEIIDRFDSEEEAYSAESAMIQLSCSNLKKYGYNCNLGGEGGIVPNEETRQKLIAAQNTPEKKKISSDMMKKRHQDYPGYLAKINVSNQYTKGHKLSDEHKKKLSTNQLGKVFSDDTRSKMSEAQSGEKHSQSKLTEVQVLEIRAKYIPKVYGYVKLAREYGVHDETIRHIIKRISWSHI